MENTIRKKIGLGIVGFLTIGLFGYVVVQYFIIGAKPHQGFVSNKVDFQGIPFKPYIYFLYIHIICSSIALLTGPFQFSKKLRLKNKKLHRNLGKIYVISIISAFLEGLYLAYYASGGIAGSIGFYTLEFAWVITTIIGFLKIRRKDIMGHQEWMLRSYAVTLAFVSFRIFSILPLLLEEKPGIFFGLAIVFSWVFNLLIAQWILVQSRKRNIVTKDHVQISHT